MGSVKSDSVFRLLNQLSDAEKCKTCGSEIWRLKPKKGRTIVVYADMEVHPTDCGRKE